jgi:NitT/TauT family transport system permease protein
MVSYRNEVRSTRVGVLLAGVLIWELLPRTGVVDPSLLPPFSVALLTLITLFADGTIIDDLVVTVFEVLVAFAIGGSLGVVSGLVLGTYARLGKVVNPFVNNMIAVPQSIFLPLFIFAFGTGMLQKIIFGITHAYFVITINTISGVQSVDERLIQTVESFGASDRELFRHVYLPAAVPIILTGLRLGMIFTVVGVVLAEMYISQRGIGKLILVWGSSFQLAKFFAGVLLVSVVTIVFNETIRSAESRVSGWQT